MSSDSSATSPSAHSDSTALLATVATLTLATSSALLWHARKPHYFSPSPSSSSSSSADDSERTRTLLDTLSSFIPIRVLRLASHRPIPVPQLPPSQQATNSDSSSPSSSGPSQSKSSRSKDRRKRGKDASAKDIRKLNHLLKPSKPPPSSSAGPLVLDDPFEHPRVIPLPPSPCPSPVSVPRKQRRVSPPDEDQTPVASPDADGPGLIVSPAASASAPSASTSAVPSASLAIPPTSVATSLSSPQPRRHRSASRTPSEDYDSHALSSHSHSQPPSLPLSPSMPPQTQIASLRGALEASRIREDKNRAEAERLGRELDAARWQAREDAHAWRKRESDLQGYIHYLSQSLHFSAQAHHHPHHHQPTFAYPLSPPFSPGAIYSAPPPPAPAVAPAPMAPSPGALSPSALELARSFPPPPSSASASSGGGSPDRGRRLARRRLQMEGGSSASSASDEGEEYECEDEMPSEEIADAILKRPEGFLGRRSSASSSAAGVKAVSAVVQRPELGELRFPSIEDWGNVWGGVGKRADVVDEEVVVEVGFDDDEDEMMEREADEEEEEEVTPDGVQIRE